MKINFKLIITALSLSLITQAQNSNNPKSGCATAVPSAEWDVWFNKKVEEYKANKSTLKTQNISIIIPVIVHVIHPGSNVGTYPNISAAQIRSQIDVLNKDFAGAGQNVNQLAATGFSTVGAANTNITFCLAQYDPQGNLLPEAGIERINYNAKGWTNPSTPSTTAAFQTLMNNTIKPNTIWDPTLYFNFWVSDVHSNTQLLGYATFPGGSTLSGITSFMGTANDDGVWVYAKSFGKTGTLQAPYNLGRTATHEVGHWLGLRHIGGDGNGNPAGDCNATDYCDDTPAQKGGFGSGQYGQNFGTPSYPTHAFSCSSPFGDMFMNFMDYTNDAFSYMFTPDQMDRMHTALNNGYFRTQLSTSSSSLCAGMPLASFNEHPIGCMEGYNPQNLTEGTPTPTYSWSVKPEAGVVFSPGTTDANPTINFPATGDYTLTIIATNSLGVSSNTLALQVEDCTSLKANSLEKGINISPNPSSGLVTINSNFKISKKLGVFIYNSIGQLVRSIEVDSSVQKNQTINLSAYPDGVYTLLLVDETESTVKRLVLSK
jgi:hypothetical protein